MNFDWLWKSCQCSGTHLCPLCAFLSVACLGAAGLVLVWWLVRRGRRQQGATNKARDDESK